MSIKGEHQTLVPLAIIGTYITYLSQERPTFLRQLGLLGGWYEQILYLGLQKL